MGNKICVLIPSYNEAKTIGKIVRDLRERRFVVYVVDDGSSDDTASIAKAEGAIVLMHRENKGKGASLIEGFNNILKEDFDAILVMDGDDQHEIDDIEKFLKKMEETSADVVIGNRMLDTVGMPYVRIMVNRFMSGLISMISGQHVPDTQCGFRLIKRAVLEKVKLESMRFDTESELVIKAARQNFKIESVPVKTIYRNETSKINPITDTIRFIALIIKVSIKK